VNAKRKDKKEKKGNEQDLLYGAQFTNYIGVVNNTTPEKAHKKDAWIWLHTQPVAVTTRGVDQKSRKKGDGSLGGDSKWY